MIALTALFAFALPASAIVDLDSDELDDVWEQYYGFDSTTAATVGQDEHKDSDIDKDNETNLAECIAGTDPFDPNSRQYIDSHSSDSSSASLTFPTVDGKRYKVQFSDTLLPGSFTDDSTAWQGTGKMLTLNFSASASTEAVGCATHEIFVNLGGTGTLADLTGFGWYPGAPQGIEALGELRIHPNTDEDYGGRVSGFIKPSSSGDFTFDLASAQGAEFSFDAGGGLTSRITVAAGSGVGADDFAAANAAGHTYTATGLVAGTKYTFEILYSQATGDDHLSLGWSGPGITGTQVVGPEVLCPAPTVNPSSGAQIIHHAFEEGSGSVAGDGTGGDHDSPLGISPANPTWTTGGLGYRGEALFFDGVDDRVEVANTDINEGAHAKRTVALWFKATNPNLAAKQVIYEEGGGTRGLNIYLDSGVLYVGGWNNLVTPENGWASTFLNTPLTDTGWHHVVLVLDATELAVINTGSLEANAFRAYLDGDLFGQGSAAELNNHTGAIAIGAMRSDTVFHDASGSGDGHYFTGRVDEFQLWNRALDGSEIAMMNPASPAPLATHRFMRLCVNDFDQDADLISDYAEKLLEGDGNYSPFDANSGGGSGSGQGSGDNIAVDAALTATEESITASAIDNLAHEDVRESVDFDDPVPSSLPADKGRVRLTRTGTLQEVTVSYTEDHVVQPATVFLLENKEPAEAVDATYEDVDGNPLSGTVTFPFGSNQIDIYVVAANAPGNIAGDGNAEYPETVRIGVATDGGGAWTVPGGSDSADVIICDAKDIPEQESLFVGAFEPEETALGAGIPIVTSGFVTAVVNGPKDMVTLHAQYDNLPGVEFEKHIHKSNPNTGGNNGLIDKGGIIFDVYNIPFSQPSGDQVGNMGPYAWDLNDPDAGSAQRRSLTIDAFFNQVPEGSVGGTPAATPPYLNVHDNVFPAGAAWAVFLPITGSIDAPDYANLGFEDPGRAPFIDHTVDGGLKLRRDIWRFLDQATFGAKEAEVDQLYNDIVASRAGNPTYHRYERFLEWIEDQILLDQTYITDLHLAMDFQEWTSRGFFEPSLWATENGNNLLTTGGFRQIQDPDNSLLGQLDLANLTGGAALTGDESYIGSPFTYTVPTMPPTPGAWPHFDRPDPAGDPENWLPTGDYPMRRTHLEWYNDDVFRLPNQASPNPVDSNGNPRTTGPYFPAGTSDGPEFGEPSFNTMRRAVWTVAIDAHDQLRQKVGFALQQINIISLEEGTDLFNYSMGSSNYQDMLNAYGLPRDKNGDGDIDRVPGNPALDEGAYYRDVIDWVIWSPQMAYYLSNLRNEKAQYDDMGTPDPYDDVVIASPDENLGRELMQLFTVGLFKMHLDGSLVLSAENGLPVATYNNDDIQEISRILTGLNFSTMTPGGTALAHTYFDAPADNLSFTATGGYRYMGAQYWHRTHPFTDFHDTGADYFTGLPEGFTILGGKFINNGYLTFSDEDDRSRKDINDALDWLSGVRDGVLVDHDGLPATVSVPNDFEDDAANADGSHGTTPPFVALRLIQRFTTSNPSAAYRYRVAAAFTRGFDANFDGDLDDPGDIPNVDGGDIANAMRTVLLDPEVRDIDAIDNYSSGVGRVFGRKISPLEAEIKLIRSLRAKSQMLITDPAGAAGTDPSYLSFFGLPASQSDNYETGTQFRFQNETDDLGMSFLRNPSVFNWYTPFFSPGGIIANSSLSAPEMSLATDNGVVQNVNYYETILWSTNGQSTIAVPQNFWAASSSSNFVDEEPDNIRDSPPAPVDFLPDATGTAGGNGTQGNVGNPNEGNSDHVIIPFSALAADHVPGSGNNLSKSTALVDALDLILNSGFMKARYPYNHADDNVAIDHDDNPSTPNEAPGENPREVIIDFVNGTTNNTTKVQRALTLLGTSPDFLIRQ